MSALGVVVLSRAVAVLAFIVHFKYSNARGFSRKILL